MSKAETGSFSEPRPPKLFRISSNASMKSIDSDHPVRVQCAVITVESSDPKFQNSGLLLQLGFYLKIVQLVLTTACIGCYSSGMKVMVYSIYQTAFPYVVYFTYLIINCVIILSYLLREKMPELLIRIFDFLGGFLFVVASGVTADVYSNDYGEDDPRRNLLAQVFLAFINAILYFADACISYHKSLHGLFTS